MDENSHLIHTQVPALSLWPQVCWNFCGFFFFLPSSTCSPFKDGIFFFSQHKQKVKHLTDVFSWPLILIRSGLTCGSLVSSPPVQNNSLVSIQHLSAHSETKWGKPGETKTLRLKFMATGIIFHSCSFCIPGLWSQGHQSRHLTSLLMR